MSYNESAEMYLETIYLLEKEQGSARGVDIAGKLNISKAGVSKAMKHLKSEGFIDKESYGTITLTEKGRLKSEKIYHNHKIITQFLKNTLIISDEDATINACRMEHILTKTLIQAIEAFLDKNVMKE